MQTTTNLGLKKPGLTDYVIVGDLNENADLIDVAVTTNKTGLAEHKADNTAHGIGSEPLVTTAQTLRGAVNEAFTSASNGKLAVGTAITGVDDAVIIPPEPTFNDLAVAIGQISTGKKWKSGQVTALGQKFFKKGDGSEATRPYASFDMSSLPFVPEYIIFTAVSGADNRITNWFKKTLSIGVLSANVIEGNIAYVAPYGIGLVDVPMPVMGATFNWIAIEE